MVKIKFILAVTVSIVISMPVAIAQNGGDEQLLMEDYVLGGADGKVIRQTNGGQVEGGSGKWLFEFETEVSDGKAILKAGEPLEFLKSSTLEKMVEDAKQRSDARYRLWGKITKFEGKNYIFATYFLAMRKIDRSAGQQAAEQKTRQSVNAPNDVLPIPEEIVAKLQTSEVLPTGETPAGLQLKQDTIFANRAGRVVEKEGGFLFEPDGLGRGIEKFEIELLPCQALEEAIDEIRSEPNPVRFNVAGILTRYNDRQYLLLQKATRTYSYGNFGR